MLEKIALDDSLKTELLDLELKLASVDYFSLLGVATGAEPAVVKAAFFKLTYRLHPDRYFRQNLGSFRARLENVFRTLAKAHQTLTQAAPREAYLKALPELRPVAPRPVSTEPPKPRARMKRMTIDTSALATKLKK